MRGEDIFINFCQVADATDLDAIRREHKGCISLEGEFQCCVTRRNARQAALDAPGYVSGDLHSVMRTVVHISWCAAGVHFKVDSQLSKVSNLGPASMAKLTHIPESHGRARNPYWETIEPASHFVPETVRY